MNELKWLTAYQMIAKEAILFIHKVIYNNQPQAICNLITFSLSKSQNICSARKPIIAEYHNSKKVSKSLIYMGIYLYNKLPSAKINKNPKCLSIYLNNHMHLYYPFDRIPTYDPG